MAKGMVTVQEAKELAKSSGWDSAAMADAYENRDVESYPVEDSEITIPWRYEEFPGEYRESFKEGWQDYVNEQNEDSDESSWVYAEDPRER